MEKQIEEILSGGYKSPIEIITGQMRSEVDNGIYKAVQGYGVNVDKEELIRALQYDRGQYEKGYADGLRHRESEWISVEERLPDNHRSVLVACEGLTIGGYAPIAIGSYGGGFWSLADADGTKYLTKYMRCIVTHWMPLPPAPKGE